jgi:antitoxin component of MazEF toxin-antitoxin module
MTTRILRVGNTLTVEIPESLVLQAALPVGEPVEWVTNGAGGIALVKSTDTAHTPPSRFTLDELLEGISENNAISEFDWGTPRGVEVW